MSSSNSVGDFNLNYIEIWCRNTTGTNSITVDEMNLIITEIV